MRAQLFLGFPLTESLKNELNLDKRLFEMFVNDMGPYLKELQHGGVSYLGKDVGKTSDLAKIKLLEANIYSILAKILPDYPFTSNPLLLFATILRD